MYGEKLRAYYSRNGKLMWNNPTTGESGILNKKRLGEYTNTNIHGNPFVAGHFYKLLSGRTLPINYWRVEEVNRRSKIRKPRELAPPEPSRRVVGFNAPSIGINYNKLNINELIKLLASNSVPRNKKAGVTNTLVTKLISNGTLNNIERALNSIIFNKSQNNRLIPHYFRLSM